MNRLILLLYTLATSAAMADIQISQGYIRATPPGSPTTAAFMTIKNTANEAVDIKSAQSQLARSTELHTALNEDGVMKMRKLEQISIPANGEVVLKPGSYHLMLIGLNKPAKEGEEVMLVLKFSDGSMQHLTLPVKKVMQGMQMSHSHEPAAQGHNKMKHEH